MTPHEKNQQEIVFRASLCWLVWIVFIGDPHWGRIERLRPLWPEEWN